MGTTRTGGSRISGARDVRAALARINGAQRGNLALAPVHTGDQIELAAPDAIRTLPCDPRLQPLLPWPGGLRRGATITATGSTSLLMLLLAGAMRDTDSWAAVVGMPQFGALVAGQDHKVPLDRLALVPEAGPDWSSIVATLLDGVDLVVVQPPPGTAESVLRSLSARSRQKGSVLIPTRPWPGADLVLEVTGRCWHGLGDGRGRLKHCDLDVRSAGRGRAERPRTATIRLHKQAQVRTPPPSFHAGKSGAVPNRLWQQLDPSPPPADPWVALRPPGRTPV